MKKLFLSALIAILCLLWYYYFMNSSKEVINEEQKEVAINVEEDDANMKKSTHLKFKGVPIDGKLDEFKSRMERKGFKHIGTQDNAEILQGDFADFKECTIYVTTLDNKDLVSKISVVFPEQKQWKYLYGDYTHLKELLTEKYGKPSACTEKFQFFHEPRNNSEKMSYALLGGCQYESQFTTDNGEITLWIEHESSLSCFVMLSYKDKDNSNIIREHAKDDL